MGELHDVHDPKSQNLSQAHVFCSHAQGHTIGYNLGPDVTTASAVQLSEAGFQPSPAVHPPPMCSAKVTEREGPSQSSSLSSTKKKSRKKGRDVDGSFDEGGTNQKKAKSNKFKRYSISELDDLVMLRLDMNERFQTMRPHHGLWTDLGVKMVLKGHPARYWESYRERWDNEFKKYRNIVGIKLKQLGYGDDHTSNGAEKIAFDNPILQRIHQVLHSRPNAIPQFQYHTEQERRKNKGESVDVHDPESQNISQHQVFCPHPQVPTVGYGIRPNVSAASQFRSSVGVFEPSPAANPPPMCSVKGLAREGPSQSSSLSSTKKSRRKGKDVDTSFSEGGTNKKESKSNKFKRYTQIELDDLVKFRLEMNEKFQTMRPHHELWTDLGVKMVLKGHPARYWESYRERWDSEFKKYRNIVGTKLKQSGYGNDNIGHGGEELVFDNPILQYIHKVMHRRPNAIPQLRYQVGHGGAKGSASQVEDDDHDRNCGVAEKGVRRRSSTGSLIIAESDDKLVGSFQQNDGWPETHEGFATLNNLSKSLAPNMGPMLGVSGVNGNHSVEVDDKVMDWLKTIKREKYAPNFAAADVDFEALFYLREDDLQKGMNIPLGASRVIWAEICKLKAQQEIHDTQVTTDPLS